MYRSILFHCVAVVGDGRIAVLSPSTQCTPLSQSICSISSVRRGECRRPGPLHTVSAMRTAYTEKGRGTSLYILDLYFFITGFKLLDSRLDLGRVLAGNPGTKGAGNPCTQGKSPSTNQRSQFQIENGWFMIRALVLGMWIAKHISNLNAVPF